MTEDDLRSARHSPDRTGHFYFGKSRTFLLWLDSNPLWYCFREQDVLPFCTVARGPRIVRGRMQPGAMNRDQDRTLLSVLVLATVLLLAAADTRLSLSPAEEHLAVQIGFEKEILGIVKNEASNQLHRLSGYDENGYQIMVNGVMVSVPRGQSDQVLWSLREKLKPRKYMAFLVEINDTLKSDKIGIIKGTDQYDILRIMHTNGENDDVSHDEVIEKLQGWGKRCPFEIIGAETDWVDIELRVMPRDVKAFAEEIYEFAPDTVDEGTGTIAELIKEITASQRLMLLWY